MVWNRHCLVSKRGARFDCNRADWTKLSYLTQMYEKIYDQMLEAGVAVKLDFPSQRTSYSERGYNTNQTGDKNFHGEIFVCGIHQTP